jgi:hypothetical protein
MSVIKALPAQTLTFKTSATLAEGDFVVISGGDMTVVKAGAGVDPLGIVVVAPEMNLVTVLMNKPVVELTAGGAVTAGNEVEIGASGVIPKATGVGVGIALKSATSGNKTWVAYRG